jgi:integrase
MRLGEMISLEWNQVDIAKKVIQLHDTKNGLPRLVPLSFHAIEELLAQPRAIQCNRVFYSWCKSGGIKKSWHTALNKAGIEDFRFHDLRHEATSRFFEKGLNMVEVACVTGHKTMQMLKRYTHPRIEGILNKIG